MAVIGNSYKSILTNLTGVVEKSNKVLEEAGIRVYDVSESGVSTMRSGEAVLADILAKYQTLDDKSKNILANAVSAGKFQINMAKAFLSEGSKVYQELLKGMETADDAMMGKLLATRLNSYNASLERTAASFKVLSVIIGSEVMPAFKTLLDGLNAGLIYLIDNKEEVGKFVSAIEKLGIAYVHGEQGIIY